MKRVYIVCEGPTEEQFVKNILAPHLAASNVFAYGPIIGTPKHKGGNIGLDRLLVSVRNVMKTDRAAYCTTFFDFYALPSGFPGKTKADKKATVKDKYAEVNIALSKAVQDDLGDETARFFIPYVQMYEFEALLFSEPTKFAEAIGKTNITEKLLSILGEFPSPEDINDSVQTAPSKRIKKLIPGYEKPIDGLKAAKAIGLAKIRAECRLFDGWLAQLENLKS